MKAIIIARVSSAEQEDTQSNPEQVRMLKEYALQKGLDIFEIHEITESSTKDNRKKFNKIIETIKKSKEPIVLIADTIDRIQRSFKESIILGGLLKTGKLELHFRRENLILNKESNSADLLRWDMGVMFARSYVLQLSDNVKRGNLGKIENGEWPGKAPIGYLNIQIEDDKKWISADPERSHFIKKIYELYAQGNHSIEMVGKEISRLGLRSLKNNKLSKSMISKTLTNPFYCGRMIYNKKEYPHKYECIIDEELYDRAQHVRQSWGKKPFKYAAKPFIFRGIIQCADCGATVTAQQKKEKYNYYCCSNQKCAQSRLFTKEESFLEEVRKVFKKLILPQHVIDAVITSLKSFGKSEQAFHQDAMKTLQAQYNRYEDRISKMYDDKLDGRITTDMYDKKLQEYEKKMQEALKAMQRHSKAHKEFHITAMVILDLAKRAHQIFQKADVSEKRQLLNYVFQNCTLNDKKLYYELRSPFDIIAQHSNRSIWYPRKDSNPQPSGPKPDALSN
jgi:site-specific DNA recombinase